MKQELQGVSGTVLFDEPLSRYTTVRIGGPADALVYPQTIEELSNLLQFARKRRLPVFILGAGSNLLVRDKGIRGIVVHLSRGFSEVRIESEGEKAAVSEDRIHSVRANKKGGMGVLGEAHTPMNKREDGVVLYAEAGVGIPRLVDFTADEGLTGLEPLAGIPGNIGGSLVMNAGTPDGEIGDRVLNVTFMDKDGKLNRWSREEIRFAYRESHFLKGSILLSVRFGLTRMASELVRGRVQKYRASRVETQPLNLPNVGSVFKNPEKKLFAGKLIEEAGLKDIRVGQARISPKHGNFIVNEGGARAKDVLALIGLIKDKVKEKFGVMLETEVRVVGEE